MQRQFGGASARAPVSVKSNSDSPAKTCFTCKRPGHESKDCRHGKLTCFKCRETEHISPNCPRKTGALGPSLNHVEQEEALSPPSEDTSIKLVKPLTRLP
jgi:hypothetical protein